MLNTTALLAVLWAAPGQADSLTLTKPRMTNGVLGPARPDNKILPGDSMVLAFTIDGLKAEPNGKVRYSTGIEVDTATGRSVLRQPAKPHETINTLGGQQVPAVVQLDFGLDQAPGEYKVKVVVTDLATNKTQQFVEPIQLLPRGFGLVRLTISADADGRVPAAGLMAGEAIWINASVLGFSRDPAKRQPHILMEMRVLDGAGKPTLAEPIRGTVEKDISPTALHVPIQFQASLNRPGKFTVELKATDKVTGKSDTRSFPIVVHNQ